LRFNKDGLIPAIVQDFNTKKVLMVAYMNEEAFEKTVSTKKATFYSRSRKKIWVKGEESGNFLDVVEVRIDCDEDTILLLVNPKGPACHMGYESCFYRRFEEDGNLKIIEERKFNPDDVYKK